MSNISRRHLLLGGTSLVTVALTVSPDAARAFSKENAWAGAVVGFGVGLAGGAAYLAGTTMSVAVLGGAGLIVVGATAVFALAGYVGLVDVKKLLEDFESEVEMSFQTQNSTTPLRTVASLGIPTLEYTGAAKDLPGADLVERVAHVVGLLSENFGEIPGGIIVSHGSANAFPEISSLLYIEEKNSFLINGKIIYRPRLPAPLVHLVWQKLDERGMPGCTITWDEAITFGGFDPDDPIGMMLLAADEVTYNLQGPFSDFEQHYDLPKGTPDKLDDAVWERVTCTTEFRNQGFSIKNSELTGDGVSITAYWLPIKLVNGKNIPVSNWKEQLESLPEINGRAEFLVSQLDHWKKDVAIDFVLRFTELVAFIKEVRAQKIGRQLPEGVYSSM